MPIVGLIKYSYFNFIYLFMKNYKHMYDVI